MPGADFVGAVRRDMNVSVAAPWDLDAVAGAARAVGATARVHLKVDTGLGRNGAFGSAFDELVGHRAGHSRPSRSCGSSACGRTSRMPSGPTTPTVRHQQEVFAEAVRRAERAGCRLEVRHLANSAATLTNPGAHYDLVRPGLAVYGLSPVPRLGDSAGDAAGPAMTLVARLALVKDLPAGQGVSYGHQYHTPRDTRVGLVPIGYADGVPRAATEVGPLWVDGRRNRIAGPVCIDQVLVDLGPESAAREGDEVVLFGPGSATRRPPSWAVATGRSRMRS